MTDTDTRSRDTRQTEPLDAGLQGVVDYLRLGREVPRLESEHAAVAAFFRGWQPTDIKSPVWRSLDRMEEARRARGAAAAQAVSGLTAALRHPEQAAEASAALAAFYYAHFVDAEAAGDEEAMVRYLGLTRDYDTEQRYAAQLIEVATLSIDSTPHGAHARLYRYQQDGFVLSPVFVEDLGTTPFEVELPTGSYLVLLDHDGYRPTRYPVHLGRGRDWRGSVRLLREDEIGDGFVHVPAGPYYEGGDPQTRGWALPSSRPEVADFLIAEHPVTSGEYLEYLNDLARSDHELAVGRSPRVYPDRGSYLHTESDGTLTLPPQGADGQAWSPRTPVLAISWHDALAYCEWRSARDGCRYRLPTEREWEKAARGVDGRWYPWGCRFDAGLCNMRDSRIPAPGPVPVDEFPLDLSPYGVSGMAGNVRDWTATVVSEELGDSAVLNEIGYQRWHDANDARVIRGGAWSPLVPRIADRYWVEPDLVLSFLGFRLAKDAPPCQDQS